MHSTRFPLVTAIAAIALALITSSASAEVGGRLGVLDGSNILAEKSILSVLPAGWVPVATNSDGTGIKDVYFQTSAGSTLSWRLDDATTPLATRTQRWLGGFTGQTDQFIAGANDAGLVAWDLVLASNSSSVLILWSMNADGSLNHAKWMGGFTAAQGAWRIMGMAGSYLIWQNQTGNRPCILMKVTNTGGTTYTHSATWLGGQGADWEVTAFEGDKVMLVNQSTGAVIIWTLNLTTMAVSQSNWVGVKSGYDAVGFNGSKIVWKNDSDDGRTIVQSLTFSGGSLTGASDTDNGQLGADYDVGGFEGNEVFRYNPAAVVATISGTVEDDGSAASGVSVELYFDHDEDGSFDQIDSTLTDGDGDFSFGIVPDTAIDLYQVKVLGGSGI